MGAINTPLKCRNWRKKREKGRLQAWEEGLKTSTNLSRNSEISGGMNTRLNCVKQINN
jgi:hypothetical protein